MTIDFNRACPSSKPVSTAIDELIERSEPLKENTRQYLGASAIGSECLRKTQYDWMCDLSHSAHTRYLRARALLREVSRQHFIRAGSNTNESSRLHSRRYD